MTAADRYRELVLARGRQQAELSTPLTEERWARYAHTYRFDPNREPDPLLAATIELTEPDDEIIEVGGGAGRIGLPLAVRAKSLTNVEPSPSMRAQFGICVHEHGIQNAHAIASIWPTDEPLEADLVVSADVMYFIAEIEPFLAAMHSAARRRVALLTWTVPPPNVNDSLFRLVLGVDEAPSPSYRDLLPVLWELGIEPDVRVFDDQFVWPENLPSNAESAIRFALAELEPRQREPARAKIRGRLDNLYNRQAEPWIPKWRTPSRAMLITWAVDHQPAKESP